MNNESNNPNIISNGEEEFAKEQQITRSQYNNDKMRYKVAIEGSEAAQRLFLNPDFKLLIVDGYFKQEPARLAGMLASDNLSDDKNRKIIMEEIIAIGKLRNRLSQLTRNGEAAKHELQELEDYAAQYGIREI